VENAYIPVSPSVLFEFTQAIANIMYHW